MVDSLYFTRDGLKPPNLNNTISPYWNSVNISWSGVTYSSHLTVLLNSYTDSGSSTAFGLPGKLLIAVLRFFQLWSDNRRFHDQANATAAILESSTRGPHDANYTLWRPTDNIPTGNYVFSISDVDVNYPSGTVNYSSVFKITNRLFNGDSPTAPSSNATASKTASSTSRSTTSLPPTSITIPYLTPTNSNTSPSLATGAKAGIGLAVGLGVLIILVLVGSWYWFKKRGTRTSSGSNEAFEKAELENNMARPKELGAEPPHAILEIGEKERFELEARSRAVEIG